MKFCDKLIKLRKNKNLSQEALAEKLGLSRQAISKWEAGASYPDMDKIIKLCSIFNCDIQDLIDDDAIKGRKKEVKNDINYLNEFLDFVSSSYNMFISMTFKVKVKFILEMFLIITILSSLIMIGSNILSSLIGNILYSFLTPNIRINITSFLNSLFEILFTIVSFIIYIHLYKIRYLNYYLTIKDETITKKQFEEPIKENIDKKVIIRDPENSSHVFLNKLSYMIKLILKFIVFWFLLSFVFGFIFLFIILIFNLSLVYYSSIFIWMAILIIGLITINTIFMEMMYRFILNLKQHFIRYLIMFFTSLILIGLAGGSLMVKFYNLKITNKIDKEYYNKESYVINDLNNELVSGYFNDSNINYVIDDNRENILIEIEKLKAIKYTLVEKSKSSTDYKPYYYFKRDVNIRELIRIILKHLQKDEILNLRYGDDNNLSSKFTIYINRNKYNKLLEIINKDELDKVK